MKRLLSVLIVLLLGAVTSAQTTVTDDMLTEFEQLVADEMAYFDIPGVAIAVIQGDEVIYAQGFGLRDVEAGEPFTTETQFRIGSTTKSMTSLLMAQMVDEGLLTWDTPVTDLFPDFTTADPELAAQITVRDLMGMDTGLVSNTLSSLQWVDWDINSLLSDIGMMTIGGDFGDFYSYNNEVYALAGYAAVASNGSEPTLDNYVALLESNVFDAIGMESAIITDDMSQLSDNYAESYEMGLFTGELSRMINPPIAFIAPAGGVWVNIEDMARYVITQMNGGVTPEGERIVNAETLAETWQPGVLLGDESPLMENTAYGMGWVSQTYAGVPVLFHDGGWAGYSTQMFTLPEDELAIIIFTNGSYGSLFGNMLNYAFVELVHDLEPQSVAQFHAVMDDINSQISQIQTFISLDLGDVSAYVGEYEGGWTVEQREGDTLWLTGHGWEFQLAYFALLDQYMVINNGGLGTTLTLDGETLSILISETETVDFAKLDS